MEDKLRIGSKFSFLNMTYQFQKETEKNYQHNFNIMATGVGPGKLIWYCHRRQPY